MLWASQWLHQFQMAWLSCQETSFFLLCLFLTEPPVCILCLTIYGQYIRFFRHPRSCKIVTKQIQASLLRSITLNHHSHIWNSSEGLPLCLLGMLRACTARGKRGVCASIFKKCVLCTLIQGPSETIVKGDSVALRDACKFYNWNNYLLMT